MALAIPSSSYSFLGLYTNMDCPSTWGISPLQSAPVFNPSLKVKKQYTGLWGMAPAFADEQQAPPILGINRDERKLLQ